MPVTGSGLIKESYSSVTSQFGDSVDPSLVVASSGVTVALDGAALKATMTLPGPGSVVLVQRTHTPDLSYRPYGVSLDVRLDPPTGQTLAFTLVEKSGRVWSAPMTLAGATGWQTVTIPYSTLTTNSGGGPIVLDGLLLTEIKITSTAAAHPLNVWLGNYRQLVDDPAPPAQVPMSGVFLDTAPLSGGYLGCLDWTSCRWGVEMARMRQVGVRQVIVRDTATIATADATTGGVTLFPARPGVLPWATTRLSTLDRIMHAAATHGIKVVLSLLYVPETTGDKCDTARYRAIDAKDEHLAVELAARYRGHPAFGGWYIPDEVDDYFTDTCSRDAAVEATGWFWGRVASRLRLLTPWAPVYVAPSFSGTLPYAEVTGLWRDLLARAPHVSHVLVQDGVGQGRGQLATTTPAALSAIRTAVDGQRRSMGAVVELFSLTAGDPGQPQTAAPAERVAAQIGVDGRFADTLFGFHWFDFSPLVTGGEDLYMNFGTWLGD